MKDTIFRQAIEQLVETDEFKQNGPDINLTGFEVQFSSDQEQRINNLLEQFSTNPTLPPSVSDCKDAVGEDVYNALVALEKLKQISGGVVFTPDTYQTMIKKVEKINKDGPITVAQARDMFGSSRKYMLAFLERLDADGITIREGDVRRLKS